MTDQYKSRRGRPSPREDRLTSLHDDLLISILSFLPIKQCVAVSAVCSRFRCLLPSIPRLDTFRLDVGISRIHQEFTFPRALICECLVVFHYEDAAAYWPYLPKSLEQLLIDNLAMAGVQDLILETSAVNGWLNLRGKDCGLFGIKSLRSLSLDSIQVSNNFDHRPLSPLCCAFLTSLEMKFCFLSNVFLLNLFASCPLLETLQLVFCSWSMYSFCSSMGKLSIHSASIKHLVLLESLDGVNAIDIHGPKLESLVVEVVNKLRIEAPKARNASFLVALHPPTNPPVALMNLLGAAFRKQNAWLMLNSSKTPNGLAGEKGIDEFIYLLYKEDAMIFNLDIYLKNRSSTMILTQFLKKCNTNFDILANSVHIENTNEDNTNEDDRLLHGSTEVELINLQMRMPSETFERFLLNQEKMTEELKEMGLQMLRSRTSREQLEDILASEESLFQISSSIANCIEMKF